MIEAQQKPFLGLKFVSVVYTTPLASTCGSRYVSPCGCKLPNGKDSGADQSVWVPSGFASANDTNGSGTRLWKSTHMT